MKKISETIVFFGSGPVAAASLELLARDFEVEAVITKPQPAHHKHPFPVPALTKELGIATLTASTTEEVSGLFADRPFKSRLGIVIDYSIILAPDVIDRFRFGIINSHFSLMPRWRGADPISFAILNGDKETGVSLMVIAKKLDEGMLIAQQAMSIPADVTTPALTKQLIGLSNDLLLKTLPPYIKGQIKPFPQPDVKPTYSRKLTKADGIIDWSKSARRLEREVRAYAGWPKSHTRLGSVEIIITKAAVADAALKSGEILAANKRLLVGCGEGSLEILSLKPAGKPEMPAEAFLAGYKLD